MGLLMANALVASDLLLIPIQTDFLALHGLMLLFDSVRTLNKALPAPIRYRAFATMYDRRARACTRVVELLAQKLGDSMFETVVSMDTRFREASALGKVIYDIDPQCRGARGYAALAEEVVALW
jgi:chromosome partitioning protein